MKTIFAFAICCFSLVNAATWLGGTSLANDTGIYGEQGSPSPDNSPNGRAYAATWTGPAGNFFLFGGQSGNNNYYNDLWAFSPRTSLWAWVYGTGQPNQLGTYGSIGLASPFNIPGARAMASTWTDAQGNFYLFGGNNGTGSFNDFWMFDFNAFSWVWIGGTANLESPSVFGSNALPGARSAATTWTDNSGNFYLFGGFNQLGVFNDLWVYNGTWTFLSGSQNPNQIGSYPPTPFSSGNVFTPGARAGSVGLYDPTTNALVLFAGYGFPGPSSLGLTRATTLNDLWAYNISTNQWTWLSGSSTSQSNFFYGIRGIFFPQSMPYPRTLATGWRDMYNRYWFLGGMGLDDNSPLNDLWVWTGGQWIWVGGANSPGDVGVYGLKGRASRVNFPSARAGASSWIQGPNPNVPVQSPTTPNYQLAFVFGGFGTDSTRASGYLNDMWRMADINLLWTDNPNPYPGGVIFAIVIVFVAAFIALLVTIARTGI